MLPHRASTAQPNQARADTLIAEMRLLIEQLGRRPRLGEIQIHCDSGADPQILGALLAGLIDQAMPSPHAERVLVLNGCSAEHDDAATLAKLFDQLDWHLNGNLLDRPTEAILADRLAALSAARLPVQINLHFDSTINRSHFEALIALCDRGPSNEVVLHPRHPRDLAEARALASRLLLGVRMLEQQGRRLGSAWRYLHARDSEPSARWQRDRQRLIAGRMRNILPGNQLGLGPGACTQIDHQLFCNARQSARWQQQLRHGQLAVDRGWCLDANRLARLAVCNALLETGQIDKDEFSQSWLLHFDRSFATELKALQPLASRQLLQLDSGSITLTQRGRLLATRRCCAIFNAQRELATTPTELGGIN